MDDATPFATIACRLVRAAADLLDRAADDAASDGLDAAATQLRAAAQELGSTEVNRFALPEELDT
jgi:hypothetical protein